MSAPDRPLILCVDDEPRVLEAMIAILRPHFDVLTSTSGVEALGVVAQHPDLVVIVSDMRMPGLDGAAFLSQTRAILPDTPRILLTGQADLSSAIAAVNQGQIFRFLQKPCPPRELLDALRAAVAKHTDLLLERQEMCRAAVQKSSLFDALTGLTSRDGALQSLRSVTDSPDSEPPACVVVFSMEIDPLHNLEETLGRPFYEEVMRAVSQRLRTAFPEALCVARWSERQFLVALRDDTGESVDVYRQAQLATSRVALPVQVGDHAMTPSLIVGIARWPFDSAVIATVVGFAASAMHRARELGGGACIFSPDWVDALNRRRQLMGALHTAIAQNLMHVHFQPIVDVARLSVHSIECLARWEHAELGNIPPATFIPLAEECGLILELGDQILRRACREGRRLLGDECTRLAVNVSIKQLLHPDYCARLESSLAEMSFEPQWLELEITESTFAQEPERVIEVLTHLRSRGIRIAMDDFGSGYSSLGFLGQIPLDVVKVDRAFLKSSDSGGDTILAAAVAIGRSRGAEVVIEGVESAAMLRIVRGHGATLAQGYLIAPPMSAAAAGEWLGRFRSGDGLGRLGPQPIDARTASGS